MKYLLIAILVVSSYEPVRSHIVTTTHVDIPLMYCMKTLALMMQDVLCPIYGRSSEIFSGEDLAVPPAVDVAVWERIMTCCLKSCSVPQLMSIC